MSRNQHNRWRGYQAIAGMFILAVVAACGSSPAATSGTADSNAATIITVAYTDSPVGIEDIPTYIAFKSLASQGINVKTTTVSDSSLLIPALIKNNVQVTILSPPQIFDAHATAPIVGFYDYKKPTWRLITASNIKTPAELDGHNIVVESQASFTYAIAKKYIADNHLSHVGIEFISGSDIRAQAIASHKIDATIVTVEDIANLESTAPGSVNILANFASQYSYLTTGILSADRNWLNTHQKIANAIAVAMLKTVHKMYADPQWAVQQTQAYYRQADPSESPALVKQIVMEYLSENLWRPNGGPQVSAALRELNFFAHAGEAGGLSANSSSEQSVFDLKFLDAAQRTVGTK